MQARSFSKMIEQSLRRYQNRAIEAAHVIEALIRLAREMREASNSASPRTNSPSTMRSETNDSAVLVLGDETLRAIARERVDTVRKNVTIDWTPRENVRANLRRDGYRPTSRSRRRERCWSRRRSSPKGGLPPEA